MPMWWVFLWRSTTAIFSTSYSTSMRSEYPASVVVISPFTMPMMPRGRCSVKSSAVRVPTWKVLWARSTRYCSISGVGKSFTTPFSTISWPFL